MADDAMHKDEKISAEAQLSEITAKTMYNMVHDVDDDRKVLFLTNPQAELVANSKNTLEKMLRRFDLPKPKLVINLIMSQGFRNQLNDTCLRHEQERTRRAPFVDEEEERLAEERLNVFMLDVVIPLAARTSAIVLVNAFNCNCILAQAFNRMVGVCRSKWKGHLPFSIISMTAEVYCMMNNEKADAEWLTIKAASKTWLLRETKLKELHNDNKYHLGEEGKQIEGFKGHTMRHDLDPNGTTYIIIDGIDEKKKTMDDDSSFKKLQKALVGHFAETLPSITFRTGSHQGMKSKQFGFATSVALCAARTPVVFLDMRKRKPIPRTELDLIGKAMKHHDQLRHDLFDAGKKDEALHGYRHNCMDNFMACTVAYFHSVLMRDGEPHHACSEGQDEQRKSLRPLHDALSRAMNSIENGVSNTANSIMSEQNVLDVAYKLADRFFRDTAICSAAKSDAVLDDESTEHRKKYREKIAHMASHIRELYTSPQFSSLNVHTDMKAAKRLVKEIVKLDRLPRKNPVRGLQLLQEAWCEYDIAMQLATQYKCIAKVIYFVRLLVAFAVVVCGVCQTELVGVLALAAPASPNATTLADPASTPEYMAWGHIVFGLAVSGTIILSAEAALNAKPRWRQLRSSAGVLESIIWSYRTRVAPFELDSSDPDSRRPEARLCEALVKWRRSVVSGGELQKSGLRRQQKLSAYKHGQYEDGQYTRGEKYRRGLFAKAVAEVKAQETRLERAQETLDELSTTSKEQAKDNSTQDDAEKEATRKELEEATRACKDAEKELEEARCARKGIVASAKKAGCWPYIDDFYSPTTPTKFIDLRVKPKIAFYKSRLPGYVRMGYLINAMLVACGAAASVLAYVQLTVWAVVVTAAATAITSWAEYSDVSRKTERYTRASIELENVLSEWNAMSEVEKASTLSISHLVRSAEALISEERAAWVSTANKDSKDAVPVDKELAADEKELPARLPARAHTIQNLPARRHAKVSPA